MAHETHAHTSMQEDAKKCNMKSIKMIVNVLILVWVAYLAFFKKDAISLETMKVGWAENFALVQQLYSSDAYKAQQTTMIKQVTDGIKNPTAAANPEAAAPEAAAPTTTIDKATIAKIKADGYINGDKNARITILEYSELLCPYCKRQHDNGIMEQLIKKYPKDVNNMFKHYIVHPAAKVLAEGAECAGDLWGDSKFYDFIGQGFGLTDKSEAGAIGLAKTLGLDEAKFTDCIKAEKFSSNIDASSEEGKTLFGVQGTPGNVIIDNEKGTWTLIAGAYPVEEFIKTIDAILAK